MGLQLEEHGLPCIISDHVSDECIVTKGLVSSVALEESPVRWAEHILQQSGRQHENHTKEIQEAGYDISTAANKLEDFYMEMAER